VKNPLKDIIPKRSRFHKTVNGFVIFFVSIFFILLIVGGITQTSTFRNYLREKVVELVNNEIYGKIQIGKIDGTIFTSLIVRDAKLLYKNDTIVSVKKVEVKISPLQIFLKKIFVRKVAVEDASIVLLKDSAGVLNISKAFPSSPSDTTKTEFPFLIKVSEVALSQINFTLQDEALQGSKKYYDILNLNDFRVSDLGLTLNAEANIDRNEFKAHLDDFYCRTNISNFNIKKFAGDFYISESELSALGIELQTTRSNILLLAQLKGFNLFAPFSDEEFKRAEVTANLITKPFSFEDLYAMVPAVDMLKGNIDGTINADGTVHDLRVEEINLKYLQTNLKCTGRLQNLDNPSDLKIDAAITNSSVTYPNVLALLPTLPMPQFQNLAPMEIDTLTYVGGIKNFASRISAGMKDGLLQGNVKFDFRKSDMEYQTDLNAFNLDVQPFVHFPVRLTAKLSAEGAGTNGKTLQTKFSVDAAHSLIDNNYLSAFNFSGEMKEGILNATCNAAADSQKLTMGAMLNINSEAAAEYECSLDAHQINLGKLLNDSLLTSSLNTSFSVSGKGFDPDNLIAKLNGKVYDSSFKKRKINEAWIVFSIDTQDETEKSLSLYSTFADAVFRGKFQLSKVIPQLIDESNGLSKSIIEKVDAYYPLGLKKDSLLAKTKIVPSRDIKKLESKESGYQPFDIDYNIVCRDLSLLSVFSDRFQLELEGKTNGRITSDNSTFSLSNATSLSYMKMDIGEDVYIVSNSKAELHIHHPLNDFSLKHLKTNLTFSSERVFAAAEVKNIEAELNIDKNVLDVDGGCAIGNSMNGSISFTSALDAPNFVAEVKRLVYRYNDFELRNRDNMQITFADKILSLKNINLYRGDAFIKANGTLATVGKQDLSIEVSKFKGYDLSFNLFGMSPNNIIDNDISLTSHISGTFEKPEMNLNLLVDKVTYQKNTFGSLKAQLDYKNQQLNARINFGKEKGDSLITKLAVNGSLPIDLAFGAVEKRLPNDKPLHLTVDSKNFDLATFGDALPFVNELSGVLNADVKINGTYEKLAPEGFLKIDDGGFKVEANNLKYTGVLQLHFDDQNLVLDNLAVANAGNVKNKGTMRGSGKLTFKGLKIVSNDITVNGDLTVLTDESKAASPNLYGNLFVATDGDIVFTMKNDYSSLVVPLLVKDASLTFPPTQTGYSTSLENFIYRYSEDSLKTSREKEIQRMIASEINKKLEHENGSGNFFKFDYDISVRIQNEATITFILAKEANQKLTSVLNGNVRYKRVNGQQDVQGELKLLEGSTLEFIKTFTATGSIKFESDVTNPYLNIVGMYKNYYIKSDSTAGTGKEEEVAVKVKLVGALNELSKTFAQSETNMAVYRGTTAIANDEPTVGLDKSDAIWFIISGKFKNEITSQDKTNAADMFSGTATSLAGSLVGGLLNTYLGDIVKSLEFRSAGTTTKFNLSGSYKKFKYTIGGTTNIFQDLSAANILIEYPLIENFVVRVERRLSETENTFTTEMINELGLKYKFEF